MTQPGYGFPAPLDTAALPAVPAHAGWLTTVRVLVAGTLAVGGVCSAALAGLVATIVYTGCFLGCSDANPAGGILLGLLAVALLFAGPTLAIVMWRRARTWHSARVWAALVLGPPGLYLLAGGAMSAIGY